MAPRKTTTKPKATTTRTKRTTKEAAPAPVSKPSKPVFRAGTWIALIVFAVVVGAAIYLTNNPLPTDEEAEAVPTTEPAFIFDSAKTVNSIEIKPAEGETVKLERNEEKVWVLTQPTEAEADQASAEAAASQIGALLIDLEFDDDPSKFGFDAPAYVITVEFEDGETGTLEVGDITPTNSGYYVRIDGKMYIVSINGIEALTNLVLFPPYMATPTPEAPPTP